MSSEIIKSAGNLNESSHAGIVLNVKNLALVFLDFMDVDSRFQMFPSIIWTVKFGILSAYKFTTR